MIERAFTKSLGELEYSYELEVEDLERVVGIENGNILVSFNDGDSSRIYKISQQAFNAFLYVVYRPWKWYDFLNTNFPSAFDKAGVDRGEYRASFEIGGEFTITTSKTGILTALLVNELDENRYDWTQAKKKTVKRFYWNNFTPVLRDNRDIFFEVDICSSNSETEYRTPVINPPRINIEMEAKENSVIQC